MKNKSAIYLKKFKNWTSSTSSEDIIYLKDKLQNGREYVQITYVIKKNP